MNQKELIIKNELSEISYKEFLLFLLRKRKRYRVSGGSMLPLLKPGEEILIDPNAYKKYLPKIGDLVVIIHPHTNNQEMVKRINAIIDKDNYFVLGDNQEYSTDSRTFGNIKLKQIIGKVSSRF